MSKYFITRLLPGKAVLHRIVAVRDKRETARKDAKQFGANAVARSAEDIDGMVKAGVIDLDPKHLHGYVPPETIVAKAPKTHKAEPGTVAEATGDESAKPTSLLDAAKGILAKPAGKRTIGGKAKAEPKRVATAPEVLAEARKALVTMCANEGATKVGIVRDISTWQANALQRRDVFVLFREQDAPAICKDIADATISTQFQVARARARDAAAVK